MRRDREVIVSVITMIFFRVVHVLTSPTVERWRRLLKRAIFCAPENAYNLEREFTNAPRNRRRPSSLCLSVRVFSFLFLPQRVSGHFQAAKTHGKESCGDLFAGC